MISFFVSHQYTSFFTFGDYDESMIKEGDSTDGFGMHWYPLTGTRYWQVEIQDLIVESDSVYSGDSSKAILDSGTSLITVPVEDFK